MARSYESVRVFEVGNPSDLQLGVFEIEQQTDFEPSDVEVAEHLGYVRIIEGFDDFQVHDHTVIDNKIRDEITDVVRFVGDRKDLLHTELNGAIRKLNTNGPLV